MATVKADLVAESSLRETSAGYEQTRIYIVKGLTGPASARHYAALQASGIPRRFDPHDAVPGIVAMEREALPDGPTQMRVRVLYQRPGQGSGGFAQNVGDPPQIEISGTLISAVTHAKNTGQEISVTYQGDIQYPAVQYQQPRFAIRYMRAEASEPSSTARDFVGKVNSASFAGSSPRTWLCGPIVGRSVDGGQTYNVTYELYYAPETWDAVVYYTQDGKIVPSTKATFRVLPEADLNQLGL